MAEKKTKPRNKGTFIGIHVDREHVEKIATVEKEFDKYFGDAGRNKSRAIRYIVECFDPAWLENFPKSLPLVSANAQAGNN